MTKTKKAAPKHAFPKHFLWGAATSSHQIEGGNHNQWSVWELENARSKAAQAQFQLKDFPKYDLFKEQAADPHNYVSGELGDHYTRYGEDFDLLQEMNMNAYRFSIEWSRIEPAEGAWNAEAITHYKKYVSDLHKRGIEPVITLFHFTLPVWFAERGGFEHRSNVKYFVRYAEKIMQELGTRVRYVITINEPEVYAWQSYDMQDWPPSQHNRWKWWRVSMNLATAHRKTAKVLRRVNRRLKIGIAKNSVYFYPGDTSIVSRISAHVGQYVQDDFFIKRYIRHCDFLGVNYYMSQRFLGYRIHNPEKEPRSDLDWVLSPQDIEFVLERLCRKYKKPLMITENGLADAEDEHRQRWIAETILAMQRAMRGGVELLGYFHWSLLDNFEWSYGRWPRFGLTEIDYATGERKLRPSAVWFGKILKKLRGV